MNVWTFFGTMGLVMLGLIILTAALDYVRAERALKRAALLAAAVATLASCAEVPPQIGSPALQRQACAAYVIVPESDPITCDATGSRIDLRMGTFQLNDPAMQPAVDRCNHKGGEPIYTPIDDQHGELVCENVDH